MPLQYIDQVGQGGIITDVNPLLLPPTIWTTGQNVVFNEGSAKKVKGYKGLLTPTVAPYYSIPITIGGVRYIIYAGLDKVYSIKKDTTQTNITRQTTGVDVDYTGSANNRWVGTVLNGVLVLTNGIDAPQMLLSTKLEPLHYKYAPPTWTLTWESQSLRANSMRAYKNFLVALGHGTATTPTAYSKSVWWSHPADPYTVPLSWDYSDPTKDAGRTDLASTNGDIVDGATLRDLMIIYKEDAIHLMNFVGGAFVMNFKEISTTAGMLAKDCAVEVFGRHFVFGTEDIYINDANSLQSIVDKKVRKDIFNRLDTVHYNKSFVTHNISNNEVWFCFPTKGTSTGYCDLAYVYNYKEDTWGMRELPDVTFVTNAVQLETDETTLGEWDDDTEGWETDSSTWDSTLFNPAVKSVIGHSTTELYVFNETDAADGTSITSMVERDGLIFGDNTQIKRVKNIYPKIKGDAVQISIGSQMTANDAVTWEGPYTFTPGNDYRVAVRSTGRIHSLRVTFSELGSNTFEGYDIEWIPVGTR